MKNYVKEYKGHKVPEGATHWLVNGFAKWDDNKSISVIGCFQGATWKKCSYGMLPNAIELPEAEQEWNGEGLPPIGAVCEYQVHKSKFGKCLVMGYFEGLVWMTSHHETSPYSGSHTTLVESTLTFRPLKTQQEKDREAFVECVKQLLPKSDTDDLILSGKLFDLGFTAPKAGDNE